MKFSREKLKGAGSEGETQAIYHELKVNKDFLTFAQEFMHDRDYQVARNSLWTLTKATDEELIRTVESKEIEYYKPAVRCVRNKILSSKFKL